MQLSLLQLPTDIKYNAFQYLQLIDLYSLEKTCHCLYIDARNPNSLYHLTINNLMNINIYTQNKRYNKIKSLNLQSSSKYFRLSNGLQNHTILPSINLFPHLNAVKIDLDPFRHSKYKFDDFLTLFYNILAIGKQKQICIHCNGWDISSPIDIPWIFNIQYNTLAKVALSKIKDLTIYGFQDQCNTIMNNMLSVMKYNNYLHMFDRIVMNTDCGDEPEDWVWDFVTDIAKYCKTFHMQHTINFWIIDQYNPEFWDEFALTLSDCKTVFDTFFLKFIFYDDDMEMISNFEEHFERWLKIGMKGLHIQYEYRLIHEDSDILQCYDNDRETILEHVVEWNNVHNKLKGKLQIFCDRNSSMQHWIAHRNYVFENELICSYIISCQH